MNAKLCLTAVLLLALSYVPGSRVVAQPQEPITVNINNGIDPATLDPPLATSQDSVTVIEQLFAGLVDLDDETAEVRPDLATSWSISDDGTVYTFTLRSDAYWTDGHPVTAGDARYGILRTLNPATGSDYAFPLFIIKNAQAYNEGTITDPAQVGLSVLDDTHLIITLEHPASYALSVFSMWMARPMPQWAIEEWGDAWTDPTHIVTDGPYKLSEWVHDDHILLDKNPAYYDAANVQIERAKLWMVDQNTAWTMYLNGGLDTAGIPVGHAGDVLPEERHFQPSACTEYYGFSTTQPPFNNPLVRKGFAAATDRWGLSRDVWGGTQQPALTFTPPGVFGHVDGYAEGVGIPYNPNQARQWLAEAGYPGGQGLPAITLTFNNNSQIQATAEYIRTSWQSTLGVTVSLQGLDWPSYLSQINNGQFQIWRMGWCGDYADANNYLRDAIAVDRGAFGLWYNATYEGLLDQAAATLDTATREALYKQAEEILVENDAVTIPLFYSSSAIAVKPYLERTYGFGGTFDIASWRIARVSTEVGPDGGSLTSFHGDTTIELPAGAVASPVNVTQAPAYGPTPGGDLTGIGHAFELTAVNPDTGQPAELALGETYRVAVHYTDAERGSAIENTLALYWWDGSQWVKEPSSVVDPIAHTISATPDHFSLWAVLGETRRLYLPLVATGY